MSSENHARWTGLWERLGSDLDSAAAFEDLVSRYAEPHRAYHTLEHIAYCLDEFDRVRHLAREPEAIEMAIWFHDAIYDPFSKANERESAELAATVLNRAGLDGAFVDAVVRLIVATEHTEVSDQPDDRLLVDIDLSILGQDDETFDRYERQIAKEYARVPRLLFRKGRAKILRAFLGRDAIFATEVFHERCEDQARRNIRRALSDLA